VIIFRLSSTEKLRIDVYNAKRPDVYHSVKHVQAKSPEENSQGIDHTIIDRIGHKD
jgi:hypothetical protein